MRAMSHVRLTQFFRDKDLNWLTQQLLTRVSKHLFRHPVHQNDPTFFIHLQDCVGSCLKQLAKAFIRQSVRLLVPFPEPLTTAKQSAFRVPAIDY
jgi:hypothetical protein